MNPLAYPFMQDAFLGLALIAVPCGLLSCYLVLRGWALMGDAVSHAVLPGVVLAWIAGLPMLLGAFAAGLAATWLTGAIRGSGHIKPDTVLGVVMSGMFAAGLVLFVKTPTGLHLDHLLFGNPLGLDARELWTTGLIGAAVTAFVLLRRHDLTLAAFDPVQARAAGLRVRALDFALLAALSAMVVAVLSAVGIILAVALLIAPGAIAFLLTRRMGAMLAVAVAVALACGLGGVAASFWIDAAPGPTVVLALTATFAVAFARAELRARRLAVGGPAGTPDAAGARVGATGTTGAAGAVPPAP